MSSSPGGFLPPLDPHQQGAGSMSRVVMTASLMLVMWMAMQIFTDKPEKKPAEPTPAAAQTTATTTPSSAAGINNATPATPDLPEETRVFAADVAKATGSAEISGGYEAKLSSHGAQFSSYLLTHYFEAELNKEAKAAGKPLERVDLAQATNQKAQLPALRSRGGDVDLAADAGYEIKESTENSVLFSRLTSSGIRVNRRYTFSDKTFALTHELTLVNEGSERKTALLDVVLSGTERKGERDSGGFFSPGTPDRLGGHCDINGSREHFMSKEVQDDPDDASFTGQVRTAAIDRHYFVAAVAFDNTPTDKCKASYFEVDPSGSEKGPRGIQVTVELSAIPLAGGESKTFTQPAFLGPKQLGFLQQFGHGLEESIDFGMLAVLSRPLLWLMVALKTQVGNYGFGIIALTLIIFALTFPLTHKSMVEMKKFSKIMKELKPELDKLKEKYGADQRQMVEKQQAFFASKGVNPFANLMGCLPMLISMPVWMALYRTLSTSVELFQQPFPLLGILDLTQSDTILFGFPLLPFIVCGLMFVSTLQQPPPDDQPQMKYMMYGMPVFFLFIMFNMASGLSIYMITNSILRMIQSYFIKRKYG
ncbi:MAG: membrane protein insertase YidC [Deltaproteobacteria bacterium]|nr:membrane protein insertase YidC [Deltaproteobacteria bacterium]